MTTFLSTNNISLYTVPAAWWLCMIPHVYAFLSYDRAISSLASSPSSSTASTTDSNTSPPANKTPSTTDTTKPPTALQKFDSTNPRTFLPTLHASPLNPALKARLARAEAASLNGYENLGFYAASVVAANISLIIIHANEGASFADEVWFVNTQCLGYLLSRGLFNLSYIAGWSGPARGVWFYGALVCATRLFWRAGDGVRRLVK